MVCLCVRAEIEMDTAKLTCIVPHAVCPPNGFPNTHYSVVWPHIATLTNHPRTWVTRPIVLRGHQYRRPGTDMEPEPLNASSDSFIDEEDDQAEVSRWLWLDRTNL